MCSTDWDSATRCSQEMAADVAEAVATKHRLEGNARADLLAGISIREVWSTAFSDDGAVLAQRRHSSGTPSALRCLL